MRWNFRKPICLFTISIFLFGTVGVLPTVEANEFRLPLPGTMVHLSPQFNPPILIGIKVHVDNPFRFDFILDKGDRRLAYQLQDESTKLVKYFLAGITIPEEDLWVNLSPYEKDRIIPQSFGLTEMGRDLLAEDYMLKQITASLIYPEDAIGKKFWKRIYEEAARKYGTTSISVNTFNKVWIVPQKAVVYENAKAGAAYVVESKLKVMLEQDYLSLEKHEGIQSKQIRRDAINGVSTSQIVREIIIPELTKEVNTGKNFAQLRQVYNSLILAVWYKKKIKDSLLEQVYVNRNKTAGVQYTSSLVSSKTGIHFKNDVEGLYQEYLMAFKKGVFNYIKEETGTIPALPGEREGKFLRKYFSGGLLLKVPLEETNNAMSVPEHPLDDDFMAQVTALIEETKGPRRSSRQVKRVEGKIKSLFGTKIEEVKKQKNAENREQTELRNQVKQRIKEVLESEGLLTSEQLRKPFRFLFNKIQDFSLNVDDQIRETLNIIVRLAQEPDSFGLKISVISSEPLYQAFYIMAQKDHFVADILIESFIQDCIELFLPRQGANIFENQIIMSRSKQKMVLLRTLNDIINDQRKKLMEEENEKEKQEAHLKKPIIEQGNHSEGATQALPPPVRKETVREVPPIKAAPVVTPPPLTPEEKRQLRESKRQGPKVSVPEDESSLRLMAKGSKSSEELVNKIADMKVNKRLPMSPEAVREAVRDELLKKALAVPRSSLGGYYDYLRDVKDRAMQTNSAMSVPKRDSDDQLTARLSALFERAQKPGSGGAMGKKTMVGGLSRIISEEMKRYKQEMVSRPNEQSNEDKRMEQIREMTKRAREAVENQGVFTAEQLRISFRFLMMRFRDYKLNVDNEMMEVLSFNDRLIRGPGSIELKYSIILSEPMYETFYKMVQKDHLSARFLTESFIEDCVELLLPRQVANQAKVSNLSRQSQKKLLIDNLMLFIEIQINDFIRKERERIREENFQTESEEQQKHAQEKMPVAKVESAARPATPAVKEPTNETVPPIKAAPVVTPPPLTPEEKRQLRESKRQGPKVSVPEDESSLRMMAKGLKSSEELVNKIADMKVNKRLPMSPEAVREAVRDELMKRALAVPRSSLGGYYDYLRGEKNSAMRNDINGGIDLTPGHMDVESPNAGHEIKFHLVMTPSLLVQLQNALGFEPVIIDIQPMTNIRYFMGLEISS